MGLAAQFGLSLLAIAALTGLAWLMGFRAAPTLSADSARTEAENALPGFRASEAAIAADGRAALVRGVDGGMALIMPRGADWVVRRLPPGTALAHDGAMLRLSLPEASYRNIRLPFADMPRWAMP